MRPCDGPSDLQRDSLEDSLGDTLQDSLRDSGKRFDSTRFDFIGVDEVISTQLDSTPLANLLESLFLAFAKEREREVVIASLLLLLPSSYREGGPVLSGTLSPL